ncbi:Uncharacterised protein [Vibrio cholerae]|nr:Uncharacterised protein [Vibrio cholerae]
MLHRSELMIYLMQTSVCFLESELPYRYQQFQQLRFF